MVATNHRATPARAVVAGGIGVGKTIEARVGDVAFPVGADSKSPNPYDLLSTSLAGCTVMALRFQAARLRYPLTHVAVSVSYHHGADNQTDYFERTIELEGALDDEQRARLLKAARSCPISRALGISIRTVTSAASPVPEPAANYQSDLEELPIPLVDPD